MTAKRSVHKCECGICEEARDEDVARLHASINHIVATLDEKHRRRFVGLLASQHGYGGVRHMARITGMSHTTILRGQREIVEADVVAGERVRAPGGGRKLTEKNSREESPCFTR